MPGYNLFIYKTILDELVIWSCLSVYNVYWLLVRCEKWFTWCVFRHRHLQFLVSNEIKNMSTNPSAFWETFSHVLTVRCSISWNLTKIMHKHARCDTKRSSQITRWFETGNCVSNVSFKSMAPLYICIKYTHSPFCAKWPTIFSEP